MALALAAFKSSSAGRWASVGCTISVMRSIGQSVSSVAWSLQTLTGRCSEFAARRSSAFAVRRVPGRVPRSAPPPALAPRPP